MLHRVRHMMEHRHRKLRRDSGVGLLVGLLALWVGLLEGLLVCLLIWGAVVLHHSARWIRCLGHWYGGCGANVAGCVTDLTTAGLPAKKDRYRYMYLLMLIMLVCSKFSLYRLVRQAHRTRRSPIVFRGVSQINSHVHIL